MKTTLPRPTAIGALMLAGLLLAGCESQLREGTGFSIDDFVVGVSSVSTGAQATLIRGAPPTAGAGTAATVTGVPVMINGGSSQQSLVSGSAFTRVVVFVEGLNDYYDLTLPAGVSAEDVILSLNTRASSGQMVVRFAVGDANGLGAYAAFPMRVLSVGTGDIQISASWTDSADVDLHVIDPSGDHIYFGNKTVPSGGVLDLDANAACSPNESTPARVFYSNENVVWQTGSAPNGTYKVFLDYWSDCGVAQTDWVVTIQRQGAAPQIITGTFVGSSSGVPDDTVSVFTY